MDEKENIVSIIEHKLDLFMTDVNKRFESLQEEIKKLTEVMLQQVRTEGNVTRLEDAIKRMGKQLDTIEYQSSMFDQRLRTVEQFGASSKSTVSNISQNLWWVMGLIGTGVGILSGTVISYLLK